MTAPVTRPNPLTDVLAKVAPAVAALVAVVTGLGGGLVFSSAQVDAVSAYGDTIVAAAAPSGPLAVTVGAVIGLINGGAALLAILKAGKTATADTTPVRSPRDVDGAPLVRADGLPLGGNPIGNGPTLN